MREKIPEAKTFGIFFSSRFITLTESNMRSIFRQEHLFGGGMRHDYTGIYDNHGKTGDSVRCGEI